MRILHVVAPSPFGGLERVVASLVATQSAQGEEVHVATMARTEAGAAFLHELARRGVTVHPATAGDRAYWRQRRDLGALARRIRPDVVHTHGYQADILAASACRRSGAAVVTTMHGFTGTDLKVRGYEWLQRRAIRRHDAVVAVSGLLARQLAGSGVPAERVEVIPNVLPPPGPHLVRATARRRLKLEEGQWVIGWVGRLSHEKGLDILLDALARLAEPRVHLAVIGDGPEREALHARAARLGLDAQVTWCGAIPRAERYYPAFDLLVLSSRTEGSPLVLLEAMAAGTPVVAAEVGGVRETISPKQGLLVPPEDPAALATAIAAVRQRPRAASCRAIRAHVRSARSSDPLGWAMRYGVVYHEALRRRGEIA